MAQNRSVKDPGTGEKLGGKASRVINNDGSFNVVKEGVSFSLKDAYQHLVTMKAWQFFLLILSGYFFMNAVFAIGYLIIGVENLSGIESNGFLEDFWTAYFFSTQTFTTVGYGAISPNGVAASMLASIEAMVGLLCFSVATGLVYGRFAKPSTRFRFSDEAIIAPYGDGGKALMFRLANERSNLVMHLKANVMLSLLNDDGNGSRTRKYYQLDLEIDSIIFFPLNWTIVHPITENSPFANLSKKDLKQLGAEILVQIKGYDETFAHDVHVRNSYTWNEIVWDASFKPAYHVDDDGKVILRVDELSSYEKAN